MMEINPESPSIPSIKLNELIIKTTIKTVKVKPIHKGISYRPKNQLRFVITRLSAKTAEMMIKIS